MMRISDTLRATKAIREKIEDAEAKEKAACDQGNVWMTDHDRIWHRAQREAFVTAGLIVFESELNPKTMKPKKRKAY